MIAVPMTGRLRLLASALLASTFGLPFLSLGSLSQAMVPQMLAPQWETFIFTSPSWDNHIPAGSPASAWLDAIAIVIRPSAASGMEKRVIPGLQFWCSWGEFGVPASGDRPQRAAR